MKTFGLFMLLFILITITVSLTLKEWTSAEVLTISMLYAYILQQYSTKENKNK